MTGNDASNDAGAIENDSSTGAATLNIVNSTISGNTAKFNGAILLTSAGSANAMNVRNATIYGNSSRAGSSAGAINVAGTATTSVMNTIITGNAGNECKVAFTTSAGNRIDDASCDATSVPVTGFDTTLANNGGPTLTHKLFEGSNAISNGVNNCPDVSGATLTNDQRGFARPVGRGCDIGAVESPFDLIVDVPQPGPNFNSTTTNDGNDGVCGQDNCTLREALIASGGAPNGVISLISGTYTLSPTFGTLTVTNGITLAGSGSGTTIIDGTGSGNRVLTLSSTGIKILSGVTIQGGNAGSGDGGGVFVSDQPLLMNDVVIRNNTAANGGGVAIGAGGSVSMTNVLIDGNTANNGGGIYNNGGSLDVNVGTISNNTANGQGGGGVYGNGGTITLFRVTINDNTGNGGICRRRHLQRRQHHRGARQHHCQ